MDNKDLWTTPLIHYYLGKFWLVFILNVLKLEQGIYYTLFAKFGNQTTGAKITEQNNHYVLVLRNRHIKYLDSDNAVRNIYEYFEWCHVYCLFPDVLPKIGIL